MQKYHTKGFSNCMLSWESHYSRLFNEAMERATKACEPSLVAAYLKQAKHWLGRLEREAPKSKARRSLEHIGPQGD
jgi:hypothetical protein